MGLFNAAVWVGGSVFFSFLAAPVFFTPEVTAFAPKPANGLVAQAVLGRYFMLHIICGTIASLHLLIGWLYSGGGFPKRAVAVVCVLLGLALISGKDGLEALQQIIPAAPRALVPGGWLVLEHGHQQEPAVDHLLHQARFGSIIHYRDASGKSRVSAARVSESFAE